MKSQLIAPHLLLACLPAQGLELSAEGGGLGRPFAYEIRGGQANQAFFFALSTQRATIPLRYLDGQDPRHLRVGLELSPFWIWSRLDAQGSIRLTGTVPTDPTLAGLSLLQQAASYPGAGGRAIDGLSEVVVMPLDQAGVFKQQVARLSVPRQYASQIPLPHGGVLIVGGCDGVILWQKGHKSTEIFDPATRRFSRGPDLTVARSSHTQTRLKDGRYLLVGGVNDKHEALKTCEVFDPMTGSFRAVGSMSYTRVYHQAVRMPDGRVAVFGGFEDLGARLSTQAALESGLKPIEIFDPSTDTWSLGPSLRTGRGAPGAQDIGNGKVLIIGGVAKSLFAPDLSQTCELYDMNTNQVGAAASLPTRTAFMTTYQLSGARVLVAGGDAGPRSSIQNFTNKATRSCYVYSAASNSWATAPSLPVATSGGDAMTLADGTMLLSGGGDNTLYWPHGNKDILALNPSNLSWSVLGSLATGRNGGELIELQAGGLAVVGGGINNAARSTNSWELMLR